jgi:hypothetical protein
MRFFFNAPLTHGRAKSHFIDKHVVLYYGSNLLHLLKKGKHNRGKTREIFLIFFLKRHILRLSGGVSCWHLPYHKKHVPSDVYDNMNFDVFSNFVDLEQAEKCACSRYRSSVSYVSFKVLWGHMLFWYGRCQQLTPPESVVLGDHFHNSEQHVIFVFSVK